MFEVISMHKDIIVSYICVGCGSMLPQEASCSGLHLSWSCTNVSADTYIYKVDMKTITFEIFNVSENSIKPLPLVATLFMDRFNAKIVRIFSPMLRWIFKSMILSEVLSHSQYMFHLKCQTHITIIIAVAALLSTQSLLPKKPFP